MKIAPVRKAILLLISLALVAGCEKPQDEYKFVQFMKVEGECSEDHVKQVAKYKGEIVHWFNVTKNSHSRYGSVHNEESLDVEKMLEGIQDPYKYRPPFIIVFEDLEQEEISGEQLKLKGISDHIGTGEGSGPQYWATCTLRVVQRLDHLPSDEQRFPKRKDNGTERGTER